MLVGLPCIYDFLFLIALSAYALENVASHLDICNLEKKYNEVLHTSKRTTAELIYLEKDLNGKRPQSKKATIYIKTTLGKTAKDHNGKIPEGKKSIQKKTTLHRKTYCSQKDIYPEKIFLSKLYLLQKIISHEKICFCEM